MATTPTFEKGKLYSIPISDFWPDPNQPRKVFDEAALMEMVDSLKKHGCYLPRSEGVYRERICVVF